MLCSNRIKYVVKSAQLFLFLSFFFFFFFVFLFLNHFFVQTSETVPSQILRPFDSVMSTSVFPHGFLCHTVIFNRYMLCIVCLYVYVCACVMEQKQLCHPLTKTFVAFHPWIAYQGENENWGSGSVSLFRCRERFFPFVLRDGGERSPVLTVLFGFCCQYACSALKVPCV